MKLFFKTALLGALMTVQAKAISTATGFLGVVNKADNSVSIINVGNGDTKTYKVGYLPHEVGIATGLAYVSNYGSAHVRSSDLGNVPGNTLSVIDLNSPTNAVQEINLGAARCAPHGIEPSKDGKHLYVTCEGRQEIVVLDVGAGKVSHSIPTNQAGSHLLVISSDESRAYVSNFWLGTVSVLDLNEKKILKQILVGRGCEGIGISPDDKSVFVTRVEDGEVVKIDTHTLEVVGRVKLTNGSSPIRVVAPPNSSNQILVADVGAGTLKILEVSDLSLTKEIKVGRQPIGLSASSTHAFVASMKDRTVSVINLQSGAVEAQYPTGNAPDGISYFSK